MIKRSCKYFFRIRKAFIYCEAARLRFDDIKDRNEYCNMFCNKPDKYNKCPIKQTLDLFYAQRGGH